MLEVLFKALMIVLQLPFKCKLNHWQHFFANGTCMSVCVNAEQGSQDGTCGSGIALPPAVGLHDPDQVWEQHWNSEVTDRLSQLSIPLVLLFAIDKKAEIQFMKSNFTGVFFFFPPQSSDIHHLHPVS